MLKWLNKAVFYEIYPTSFYDSNNDGIGDIKGIEQKIDYIKSLGVDCVWINPIFSSPFKDGGYDIKDYYEIDKRFGTMDDLDSLIRTFHNYNIKIILDLVVGHTSNKHKWFKKSSNAKRNKYSDYYIWTNSNFESYPNMIYGLSKRDGGYLQNYYASQPALNFGFNKVEKNKTWQMHYTDSRLNPLREEILNIMRFYLNKGIDGFRVDMAASLVKNGPIFDGEHPYVDNDEKLEGIKWLWNTILGTLRKEYSDKVYIAEWVVPQYSIGQCGFDMDFLTHDTIAFNTLYRNEKGLNLTSYFERGYNYFSEKGKGDLNEFVKYIEYLYPRLNGQGCFTIPTGTHDEIRMPTGKSDDLIKTIFAFLLTIKQIPFIYYGDEIGMEHNFNVSKDGGSIRTGARTPMQWNESVGRGFSNRRTTYLPVSNKKGTSVDAQENDTNSILNTVRELIRIRKEHSAFDLNCKQNFICKDYPVIYERKSNTERIVVIINPSNRIFEKNIAYKEILIKQNIDIKDDFIILKEQSFILLKIN